MSHALTDLASTAGVDAAWRPRMEEGRALLRLATPIMLIALVNMGMSVTDTLMVSVLFGTDALAAVAVGSDLYSIVFYLCAGILAGISPFYTAAVTRADEAERIKLKRLGWMIVGLLAALTVPVIWFAPSWLVPFGLEPDLLQRGHGYTRAMALTLVPMLGVMLYRTILTAAEKPKVFLKVTLAMLPLNAAANYLFMTGLGPLPGFGPMGAGLSSLLVALASLTALAAIADRVAPAASRRLSIAMTAAAWCDWRALGAVLQVGIPIGIATVTELGIYLGATLYAATLGAADVAAHTLTLRTAGVAYAVPAALLQASMVRMARAQSLEAKDNGQAVVTSSLLLSIIAGTLVFLVLAVVADPLSAGFFDNSDAGVAAASLAFGLLILLGAIEFIAGPGQTAAGLLRGCKDTRVPMAYVLFGHWAVSAPLGIYLCEVQGQGVTGIWIGLASGTFVTAVLTVIRLFTIRRR